MKIETLLPLGKVDPGLRAAGTPLDISTIAEDAKLVEDLGYDSLVVEETKDDPYVVMALAAQATTRLKLGTSVAIAFPRSPATTAMSAWTLQKLSKGRFTLGLGTQVRGHIVRRHGMEWSAPGSWMRDYTQAVRAIWDCWQSGSSLDYQGSHYKLSLMVPLFNPGPIEHPEIPIHIAAVNSYMCQVAGEVADGVRPHPVCTPKYIEQIMLPAVRKGAAKTGRSLKGFCVSMKPLVASAPDEASLHEKVTDARARIAFYASTPAYKAAFDLHGLGELADEMAVLSKAQRWDEMPERISDKILHTFVTIGTYDNIAERLTERYAPVVTNIEFSIAASTKDEQQILKRLVSEVQATPGVRL